MIIVHCTTLISNYETCKVRPWHHKPPALGWLWTVFPHGYSFIYITSKTRTQQRLSEFGKEVPEHIYKNTMCEIVDNAKNREDNIYKMIDSIDLTPISDQSINISLDRKYYLSIKTLSDNGPTRDHLVAWVYKGECKEMYVLYNLHPDLLLILYKGINSKRISGCKIVGYTEMKTNCDGVKSIFHSHSWFNGGPWYNWAYLGYMIEGSIDGNERTVCLASRKELFPKCCC